MKTIDFQSAKNSVIVILLFWLEFEKWRAIRASVGGVGGVLRGWRGCRSNLRSVLACVAWVGVLRANVSDMLLLLLLLILKYYPEKWKNVSNRFELWFKRITWLEEQVLLYVIWTGNAKMLNMSESAEICPNVGKHA